MLCLHYRLLRIIHQTELPLSISTSHLVHLGTLAEIHIQSYKRTQVNISFFFFSTRQRTNVKLPINSTLNWGFVLNKTANCVTVFYILFLSINWATSTLCYYTLCFSQDEAFALHDVTRGLWSTPDVTRGLWSTAPSPLLTQESQKSNLEKEHGSREVIQDLGLTDTFSTKNIMFLQVPHISWRCMFLPKIRYNSTVGTFLGCSLIPFPSHCFYAITKPLISFISLPNHCRITVTQVSSPSHT